MQCQVSVPSSEAAVVEILWFYNDQQITGSFPATIELSPTEPAGDRSSITSTASYQGRYYCQIAVDGDNSIAPSNTLVLVAESEFLSACVRDQEYFSAEAVCVGTESTTTVVEVTSLASETTDMTTAMTTAIMTTDASTSVLTTLTSTAVLSESSTVLTYVLIAIATVLVFGTIIMLLVAGIGIVFWKRKTAREL